MPRSSKPNTTFSPDKDEVAIVDAYLKSHHSSYDAWCGVWEKKKETAFRDLLLSIVRENKEGLLILMQDQSTQTKD